MLQKLFTTEYPESNGYYTGIPIRINNWVLEENSEDSIIFMTTDEDICSGHGKTELQLFVKDGEWVIRRVSNACATPILTKTTVISNKDISRNRALWHAKKHMEGKEYSLRERFNYMHLNDVDLDLLYDVDPFFEQDSDEQTNPFYNYL